MSAIVNQATPVPITFLDAAGVGKEGLTITATARLAGSATTVSATSVTDRDDGNYDVLITLTSVGTWRLTSTTTIDGDSAMDVTDIDVLPAAADPAAIADALAAVQTILLGSEVTVTSPLATDGTIMLLQGDTYDSDETRAIVFSLTGQPNLTSATATLLFSWGVDSLALTGVITNAGQATQTITVELTATQTATLPVTGITYALKATLANAHVVTMQTGRVIVSAALPAN